jgi:hypothetical protein
MRYMPMKSTQTNKYETACFIQEAPTSSEISPRGYKLKKSIEGKPFIIFEATLQTYGCYNRMQRRYDAQNVVSVINNDERIQTLKRQNKWRGELNHPNPDIKGTQLTDIRMTIPDPLNTSHFINNDRLEGDRLKATITTHPRTEAGLSVVSEVVDLGAVPSFSVRLLGNMIPNAPRSMPNIRVSKVITFDLVDFPSHPNADADIAPGVITESAIITPEAVGQIIFLKELAKYCAEKSETMQVVCESFQISTDEIMGIHNGNIIVEQNASKIAIPLAGDVRREALSFIMERGL